MSERRVDVGGVGIAVEEHGEGIPYVFLHGWLRNRYQWRDHAPAVAREGRAILIDLPGFGASDVPKDAPYDTPYFAAHVRGVLDALGLDRVRVIAHGLGAAAAIAIALETPSRVERILAVSPSWKRNPLAGLRAKFVIEGPLGEYAFRLGVSRERVRHLLLTRHFHREPIRVDDALVDSVWEPLQRPGARRAAWLSLRADVDAGLEAAIPGLQVPLCAVWGYNDAIHPVDVARDLERVCANAVMKLIPNCGHAVSEMRPRSFTAYLNEFMGTTIDPEKVEDGQPRPGTQDF